MRARDKGIYLRSDVAADLPVTLVGDSHRLSQMLNNLIGNAIKFTQKVASRAHVVSENRISGAAGTIALHFEVHDTGIGIPEDQQAAVFEPFKQADDSTTRKYGGTGLGLSISTRLVEGMGGRLWLESERERAARSISSFAPALLRRHRPAAPSAPPGRRPACATAHPARGRQPREPARGASHSRL